MPQSLSDLNLSSSVSLSEAMLNTILKDALRSRFPGFTVSRIQYKASPDYDVRGEPCGTRFNGVDVFFEVSN